MTIVGVTGYAQHGKDTVANLLVREYGYTRVAFADALKSMALVLNPYIIDPRFHTVHRLVDVVGDLGWEGAKELREVRRFLQVLGTEGVRGHLGDDAWVNALDERVRDIEDVVIPDVRFPNEEAYVKSFRGGRLILVERFNEDGTPFDNGVGTDHPSESHIKHMVPDVQLQAYNVEQLESLVRDYFDREVA